MIRSRWRPTTAHSLLDALWQRGLLNFRRGMDVAVPLPEESTPSVSGRWLSPGRAAQVGTLVGASSIAAPPSSQRPAPDIRSQRLVAPLNRDRRWSVLILGSPSNCAGPSDLTQYRHFTWQKSGHWLLHVERSRPTPPRMTTLTVSGVTAIGPFTPWNNGMAWLNL